MVNRKYKDRLFSLIFGNEKLNLYGANLIKLPTPQYFVFYNGKDEIADEVKYRLSDAFGDKSVSNEFEWTATVKNINLGRNKELMEKCKVLKEYATLVDKIKRYTKEMPKVEDAIDRAVGECIKEGILEDFLIGHRAEVKNMCLTEYNEEEVQAGFREDGLAEGIVSMGIDFGLTKDDIISRLQNKLQIKPWQAEQYYITYSKKAGIV